jgi:hypothetical protein
LGSVLLAHEVPESGDDTVFASMYAAYEALSGGLKATLRSLRAVHSSRHVFDFKGRKKETDDLATRIGNPELATQDAVHPVVITYPDSGLGRTARPAGLAQGVGRCLPHLPVGIEQRGGSRLAGTGRVKARALAAARRTEGTGSQVAPIRVGSASSLLSQLTTPTACTRTSTSGGGSRNRPPPKTWR